jgi:hypothetical protein
MPPKTDRKSRPTKTATDILVTDADGAMRKFQAVTRTILNAPKAEVDAVRQKGKKANGVK